ncbi:hypothetical protein BT96DRAFT_291315 [Gymnopus androsaceus JB14]|uniref:Secreted protein n=1 Tax=Gymnopus androsaceus JB14 TaxID=1447944 RepID=A0A6A4H1H6_9AGAR|nr:hypothetical protein BT96DRAFT_291315 [Gymnopus androsaceus JB14]
MLAFLVFCSSYFTPMTVCREQVRLLGDPRERIGEQARLCCSTSKRTLQVADQLVQIPSFFRVVQAQTGVFFIFLNLLLSINWSPWANSCPSALLPHIST